MLRLYGVVINDRGGVVGGLGAQEGVDEDDFEAEQQRWLQTITWLRERSDCARPRWRRVITSALIELDPSTRPITPVRFARYLITPPVFDTRRRRLEVKRQRPRRS